MGSDVTRSAGAIRRQGKEMEAPPLERKLVAILAADVAGYSRPMGVDEEGTLATFIRLSRCDGHSHLATWRKNLRNRRR